MSGGEELLECWVPGAAGSGFDIDHLPFGVIVAGGGDPHIGVRIGQYAFDATAASRADAAGFAANLGGPDLNPLLGAGPHVWQEVRNWLVAALTDRSRRDQFEPYLIPVAGLTMRLPFTVADYVDFYASIDHATNVGRMFRPQAEPLLPNWRHLPVGYHGRSGTVVVTGSAVVRPHGQRLGADGEPTFGPSQRLDIEAELGFVVGVPSELSTRVSTDAFADHVFGIVGLNDWSARDIQAWEYVPLGPFLGKSFATSISAWVTPLTALQHARIDLPLQDAPPLPYLATPEKAGYDIDVEVVINGTVVSRPPYRSMYWGPSQMLAHMTANGASLRTGDLYGSGTISGPDRHERGSLLELCWGGAEPWSVDGRERTFLEDGDEVVLRYSAPGALGRLTLGEVSATIIAAL